MRALRIGIFLGVRQIQRASVWATLLIITIVLFTFLNLVVVSGILLGIVDGAISETKTQALGDITIVPLDDETRVQETERVLAQLASYHEIESFSARYKGMATIEANYQERRNLTAEPDVIAVHLTGIDPVAEATATGLSELVVEGEYLDPNESGYLLLGKYSVDRYAAEFGNVFDSLANVYPGDSVLVTVGEESREFIVKGIVASKVDFVSLSVYLPEREFRRMFDRVDHNANEIVVKLMPGYSEKLVQERLRNSTIATLADIDAFSENIPKFVVDVRDTFTQLSFIVGMVGLVIASITIFIVVFINAIARRRHIGILKAIGITRHTIECAYITQAVFYAVIGAGVGMLLTYFVLIPYFVAHPLDFPYSDASLSITMGDMVMHLGILIGVATVAGYLPAHLITRQNTLDAILGR